MHPQKNDVFQKIEFELLSLLLDYVSPFLEKKTNDFRKKKESSLEEMVNSRPKIGINDFKELEAIIKRDSSKPIKSKIVSDSSGLKYSIKLSNKIKEKSSNDFALRVRYRESDSEEKLTIESLQNNEKYFAEILKEKDKKDSVAPYSLAIEYSRKNGNESLVVTCTYSGEYLRNFVESKDDMASRVPLKWLNIIPETQMGGVLGFTYLGENFMGRRADLTGWMARMVDIHESIHTPDEYETRILTDWIMEKAKVRYKK